jgi:hypothetical protein
MGRLGVHAHKVKSGPPQAAVTRLTDLPSI